MVSKVRSLGLGGIKGYEVSVECFLSSGLPGFDIVGLADIAVKEARERVRAAIKNCGIDYPVSRITINLAPADKRKAGTVYDLPVLLSILIASGIIDKLPGDTAFFGELSLTGEVRAVPGALPMALSAERFGIKKLFVPADSAPEAAYATGVAIYPVAHVDELLEHLMEVEYIKPVTAREPAVNYDHLLDFSEVKGQQKVKRALEVAAAGGHNILLTGTPGAGKSMLAKRLITILPDMSYEEMLETTEIHSVAGLTSRDRPIMSVKPFRAPHHSVSPAAMTGGTSNPKPGEISLAHNGVLFLDEMPEFPRNVLEALRQPLEDGVVTISRASQSVTYPCRFMLVCAMNPCKCGWYGHMSGKCTCTESCVARYHERLSGPLLDRLDLAIETQSMEFEALRSNEPLESSADIRLRVNKARVIQQKRFRGGDVADVAGGAGASGLLPAVRCNAHIGHKQTEKYCKLSDECVKLMKNAFEKLSLTARSYDRILRVARTIADLEAQDNIAPVHLAEAIQYRQVAFRQ